MKQCRTRKDIKLNDIRLDAKQRSYLQWNGNLEKKLSAECILFECMIKVKHHGKVSVVFDYSVQEIPLSMNTND